MKREKTCKKWSIREDRRLKRRGGGWRAVGAMTRTPGAAGAKDGGDGASEGAASAPGAWLFQIPQSESGKTDPIQLADSIDSSVHDFMTKTDSQPDATAPFLHSDVICKNKKFTPPFSLLLRTGFETGHLATQNRPNRASVEKFKSLCKIQEFVRRLYYFLFWFGKIKQNSKLEKNVV